MGELTLSFGKTPEEARRDFPGEEYYGTFTAEKERRMMEEGYTQLDRYLTLEEFRRLAEEKEWDRIPGIMEPPTLGVTHRLSPFRYFLLTKK